MLLYIRFLASAKCSVSRSTTSASMAMSVRRYTSTPFGFSPTSDRMSKKNLGHRVRYYMTKVRANTCAALLRMKGFSGWLFISWTGLGGRRDERSGGITGRWDAQGAGLKKGRAETQVTLLLSA